MKILYMHADLRKVDMINAIMRIDDEAVLSAIEKIIDERTDVNKKRPLDFSDVFGTMSEEEADAMKKVIEENFRQINPNAWR